MLHILDFASKPPGGKNFSKIKFIKEYHLISVHAMDIPKTSVITPFDLFEFLHIPFGLTNVPQAFKLLMDSALRGLDHVFIYLDDLLVASSSPDQHLRDLTAIFDHLE